MFLGPCTFTKDFKLTVQSVHLIKDILLILKYFWNCGHFLILICCNKYFSKWQNGDNYLNKFHYSESIHTFFLKTVHGHIKQNIVAEPAPKTRFSGIRYPESDWQKMKKCLVQLAFLHSTPWHGTCRVCWLSMY